MVGHPEPFCAVRGNTVGIVGAYVRTNSLAYGGWDHAFLSGQRERVSEDQSTIRDILMVSGVDAQAVADALPALLPLLGIPANAVGMVYTGDEDWGGFVVPE